MTYASEVLADSPLLYWRLDEASGTTAADATGNGRSGTYAGSPTLGVTSLVTDTGTAVQFDGSNDMVSVADTTDLTAFTVEAWVKTSVANNVKYIATRWDGAGNMFILYTESPAKPAFVVRNSGGTTVAQMAANSINDGAPHYVALTYNGASVVLYVDGANVASASLTGAMTTANTVFRVGGDGASAHFNGVIDEVAYYSTALSSGRISAHYSAGSTPPAPITIHPNKITSTGTVHAPAIVPYIPPPVDGNLAITAELAPATKYAACIEPDRSAQLEPARHVAGVNAT